MTSQPERVLGAIRQSKTRDRSVSREAQERAMLAWIEANRAAKAAITTDLSTSGSVSAFQRKGVGPYLTEADKIATWDTLVVTRLDRACRDVGDYLRLAAWCDKHGKRFVVLDDPSLDTSTPQGRAMATMRATFAQLERELAKARNKERYEELIAQGKWPGGRMPFGWRYNKETSLLEPDTGGTADILAQMADLAIDGKSHGQIARWLGEQGIGTRTRLRDEHGKPTGRYKSWSTESVRWVLRSQYTAEVLGEAKAAELRAALRTREQDNGERVGGYQLLRVAYCRICRGPVYGHPGRRPNGWRSYPTYHCPKHNIYFPLPWLEEQMEKLVLLIAGDLEVVELRMVPGDDHQAAIHALEREIDMLERISGTDVVIRAKQHEIDHLRSLPFSPDHFEPVSLGVTVADYWATLDYAERGTFLRQRKVRVYLDRDHVEFHGGLLLADTEAETRLLPLER